MGRQHDIKLQNKMIRMFDDGYSASRIAKVLGLYTTSVTRVLKRNGRKMCTNKGANHPNWNGGRGIKCGYWTVYAPDHPRAMKNRRVWEHIIVMEKYLGREITKDEHIHHIDFNRKNNSPDNLYVCSAKEHAAIHGSLERVVRKLLKYGTIKWFAGEYVV